MPHPVAIGPILPVEIAAMAPQGPQNFLRTPLRGDVRCAHGAARTDHPPVSTDPARTAKSPIFWISFSQILQNRSHGWWWHAVACVACLSGH